MQLTFTKSRQAKTETLFPNKLTPKFSLKDIQDKRDYRRIKTLVDNQVPFFPPTMCPADTKGEELESLEWALNYYGELGFDQVCIQRKMMGSRCVVVLRNSPEESFAISKNGFLINHVDLTNEIERLWNLVLSEGMLTRAKNGQMLIDCELMPWSALGKGLIEKNFYGYAELVETELNALKGSNDFGYCDSFETALRSLTIASERHEGSTPDHLRHSFALVDFLQHNTNPSFLEESYLADYRKSLSNYDQEYEPKIEPFQIVGMQADLSWNIFRGDGMLVVKTDEVDRACAFRDALNVETTEGVVVKPLVPVRGVAPYLKVRNKEYLRIVYGPDWTCPAKSAKLIQRKRIKNKLRASIRQWNACLDMLEGEDIETVLCGLLNRPEGEMDPRL
jgi:hypothetical protein